LSVNAVLSCFVLREAFRGHIFENMLERFFRKLMAVFIVVSLVLGQGAMMPVAAMSSGSGGHNCPAAAETVPAVSVQAASKHGCCAGHEKPEPSKAKMTCFEMCHSTAQAMMPPREPDLILYSAAFSFAFIDTAAIGRSLLPDPPPPRA
jgi:hypothetical protein